MSVIVPAVAFLIVFGTLFACAIDTIRHAKQSK